MEALTYGECETLIAALDAWVLKDASAGMMDALIGSMAPKDDELAAAKITDQIERAGQQRAVDKRARKEESMLLQAKLIGIRNGAEQQGLDGILAAANASKGE